MNLAQAIAPEWAQEGCPQRFAPKRPESAQPPASPITRTVDQLTRAQPVLPPPVSRQRIFRHRIGTSRSPDARRPRGTIRRLILRALANNSGKSFSSSDLAAFIGDVDANKICAVLPHLCDERLVERLGLKYQYRYRITAEGRARLRAIERAG